jgi:hypothetical protein
MTPERRERPSRSGLVDGERRRQVAVRIDLCEQFVRLLLDGGDRVGARSPAQRRRLLVSDRDKSLRELRGIVGLLTAHCFPCRTSLCSAPGVVVDRKVGVSSGFLREQFSAKEARLDAPVGQRPGMSSEGSAGGAGTGWWGHLCRRSQQKLDFGALHVSILAVLAPDRMNHVERPDEMLPPVGSEREAPFPDHVSLRAAPVEDTEPRFEIAPDVGEIVREPATARFFLLGAEIQLPIFKRARS